MILPILALIALSSSAARRASDNPPSRISNVRKGKQKGNPGSSRAIAAESMRQLDAIASAKRKLQATPRKGGGYPRVFKSLSTLYPKQVAKTYTKTHRVPGGFLRKLQAPALPKATPKKPDHKPDQKAHAAVVVPSIPSSALVVRSSAAAPPPMSQTEAANGLARYLSSPMADWGWKGAPSATVRKYQALMFTDAAKSADGRMGPGTRRRAKQLGVSLPSHPRTDAIGDNDATEAAAAAIEELMDFAAELTRPEIGWFGSKLLKKAARVVGAVAKAVVSAPFNAIKAAGSLIKGDLKGVEKAFGRDLKNIDNIIQKAVGKRPIAMILKAIPKDAKRVYAEVRDQVGPLVPIAMMALGVPPLGGAGALAGMSPALSQGASMISSLASKAPPGWQSMAGIPEVLARGQKLGVPGWQDIVAAKFSDPGISKKLAIMAGAGQ